MLVYLEFLRGKRQLLWFLAPLSFLWANLWGGFFFIPGIFFLIILAVQFFSKGTKKSLPIIAGLLASLINPYFIRIWIYLLTFFGVFGSSKWYSSLAGALEVSNISFSKEIISSVPYLIFLSYALFIIIAFAILLLRDRKKFWKAVRSSAVFLYFLFFGFIWVRLIPLATLATLPLFAQIVSYLYRKIKINKPVFLRPIGMVSYLILFCLAIYALTNPWQDIQFSPPQEQIDFILQNNLPKTILTSSEIVGYTYYSLYPNKTFIDARDDFFDENETIALYGQLFTITPEKLKEVIQENQIDTALISKDNDYLTTYFDQSPDWALVYLESNGILFVRRGVVSEEFLKENELQYISLATNAGVNKDEIKKAIEELEKFILKHPDSKLATGQLASLYRFDGDLKKAESTLKKIPEGEWDFVVKTEMGRIKAAQGLCLSAENWFNSALKERNERMLSRIILDLAILNASCLNNQKRAEHYLRRYLSFPLPSEELDRAREIGKSFNIKVE
jgi:tetratricopeptide (TPR) repeat protein